MMHLCIPQTVEFTNGELNRLGILCTYYIQTASLTFDHMKYIELMTNIELGVSCGKVHIKDRACTRFRRLGPN